MIDVKTAVRTAINYVQEFQEYFPPRDARLEETELLDDGYWEITLSFLDNTITGRRTYKVFRIDAQTGDVKSMKVRALLVQ